jgi:hypothetical protein
LEVFGGLTSAVLLMSMFVVFIAAAMFDHHRLSFQRLSFLAVFEAVTQLVRGLGGSVLSIFLLDSLSRVPSPLYFMGTDGPMFLAARDEAPLAFYAYREVIYSLGNILASVAFIFLATKIYVWWGMWAIGSVGVILGLGLAQYKVVE